MEIEEGVNYDNQFEGGLNLYDSDDDDDENGNNKYKKEEKKVFISIFHYEQFQKQLSEKMHEISLLDFQERKRLGMIMMKGVNFSRTKRLEIINKIQEQIHNLMISLTEKLKECHTNIIDQEEAEDLFPIDSYINKPFLISNENDEYNEGARAKILVVLAHPSAGQLKMDEIDGNSKYTNYLSKIKDELNYLNEIGGGGDSNDNNAILKKKKTYEFIFSIPVFLGTNYKAKKEIMETNSLMSPFQAYTHDLVMALDPDIIIAVGQFAFQNALNSFGEKSNSKNNMIKMGSSSFYSDLGKACGNNNDRDSNNDDDGLTITIGNHQKQIRLFYCPHPFTIYRTAITDEGEIIQQKRDREKWDFLWKQMADILNPAKRLQSSETFINNDTNTSNYNASNYLKSQANTFYKTKDSIETLRNINKVILPGAILEGDILKSKKNAIEHLKSNGVDYSQKKIAKRADPVKKLPKGKKISIGMDKFLTKGGGK